MGVLFLETIDLLSVFKGLNDENKFKLYRELWQKAGNYEVLTNYPLHLDIELSGICNLKCEFCFQNGLINQPLGFMDVELFKQIIDDGVKNGLCAIKLQIRGESFLHPRLFECISYAKNKGVLDVQITTNATLLNRNNIQEIIESGLDAIIFSVDSHHGNSFVQKNNSERYSSTEKSIKELLKYRLKLGRQKPWIRLQSSIPQLDRDSFLKTKNYLKMKFPEADIFVVNRIYNYNNDIDAFPDLHINYELEPCNYLMHRLAIFWNGDITICCADYNNKINLGNVAFKNIKEIWLSARMNAFRQLHKNDKRKDMSPCKHCGACLAAKNNNSIVYDNTKQHCNDYQS